MSVTVREAVDADWVEAGRICYEAFATLADRHGFPHDFPTVAAASDPIRGFINHPRIYGVVAERMGGSWAAPTSTSGGPSTRSGRSASIPPPRIAGWAGC
jgi:hypothetical protein